MSCKNNRFRCDYCGCFISNQDLENRMATRELMTVDSHFTIEQYETKCKKCEIDGEYK